MQIRTKVICLFLLTHVVLAQNIVDACSCFNNRNIIERRDRYGMAFIGSLNSISVDTVEQRVNLNFIVSSAFKKEKKESINEIQIETRLGTSSCGYEIGIGEKALIFAGSEVRNGKLVYITSSCFLNIVNPTASEMDSLSMPSIEKKEKRSRH